MTWSSHPWEVILMHSAMYERLKRLYLADRLTDAALQTAVKRGWITNEEKEEIIEAKKETAE